MALQPAGKALIGLVIAGALVGGLYAAQKSGKFMKFSETTSVDKITLADNAGEITLTGTAKEFAGLPGKKPAKIVGAEVRFTPWAWNSQMGCLYAVGGPVTTENSLMAKHGVKMTVSRQDDNSQLAAGLIKLAEKMYEGETDPAEGTHFIGIMGDGAHAFISNLNETLVKEYGEEYKARIVGSCGYSRGEDAVWGPQSWVENPQTMKGGTVLGVLRDGDINIALRYAADNGVKVNPDQRSYDPDALNFMGSDTYITAAQEFVAGKCEDRRVVREGKPTGETKNVCADAVATWTPGDVIVAEGTGAVRIISTAPDEYANQMPHALITIDKWAKTHKSTVENVLAAFAEGGDQVLTYPQALQRAAEISHEINQEAGWTGQDWLKYYVGTTIKNRDGVEVPVGGSKANNLNDMLSLFGLAPGMSPKSSRFRATYTAFGNMVHKLYPEHVPTEANFDDIVDLSYLRVVAARYQDEGGEAEKVTVQYAANDTVERVVGNRAVSINFATGSATLTPAGEAQLEELFNELSISNLRVLVGGHTDNTGNPEANRTLSQARADAVKSWLEQRSPGTFPAGRIVARGYGQDVPKADNTSPAGRAQNRRVEITIGQ